VVIILFYSSLSPELIGASTSTKQPATKQVRSMGHCGKRTEMPEDGSMKVGTERVPMAETEQQKA
jgi:hypothetical protein